MKIKTIITGATGMVGEGVLLECLNHPEVERVLVINRRPGGVSHPKLREMIHIDFFNLAPIEQQLIGFNCVLCLIQNGGTHQAHNWPQGSYGYFSNFDTVDTAIIYVHGFFGNSQTTWEHLQYHLDRIEGDPFRSADLFFFDYAAEANFVQSSVGKLQSFLSLIYPLPPAALFEINFKDIDWRLNRGDGSLRLRDLQPYSHLVLVGHSLGAVVIRRLVADAALSLRRMQDSKKREPEQLSKYLRAELRLMAPAHLGFQFSGIKGLIAALGMSPMVLAFATAFRSFSDLKPGCHTLNQLQRETAQMVESFPTSTALRPQLLWGEREDVVVYGRFDTDWPDNMVEAQGKNHVEVCKLNQDYLLPAHFTVSKPKAHGT